MANTIQSKCKVCLKRCYESHIGSICCYYCKDRFHNQCVSFNEYADWLCKSCLTIIFPYNWIEDDVEFIESLTAHNSPTSINARVIKNSIQLRLTNSYKPINKDMDTDKNCFCYLDHIDCNYYLEADFNQLVSNSPITITFQFFTSMLEV